MTTETLDAVTGRINADPAHAARVTAALDALMGAAAALDEAPDEPARDAALVGLVRTWREQRDVLVAAHGEAAGLLGWRDAMALVSRRAGRASEATGTT